MIILAAYAGNLRSWSQSPKKIFKLSYRIAIINNIYNYYVSTSWVTADQWTLYYILLYLYFIVVFLKLFVLIISSQFSINRFFWEFASWVEVFFHLPRSFFINPGVQQPIGKLQLFEWNNCLWLFDFYIPNQTVVSIKENFNLKVRWECKKKKQLKKRKQKKKSQTNERSVAPTETLQDVLDSGLPWGQFIYGEEEETAMAESTDPVISAIWDVRQIFLKPSKNRDQLVQSWALSVFLNFFNSKKLFVAFFIKLIWLGMGFLNRTGAEK